MLGITSPPTPAAFRSRYGLSVGWVRAFDAFGILLILVFAGMLMFQETYRIAFRILTSEHGPIELTTFIGFFVAGILSARLAWQASRHAEPRHVTLFYAGFAAFCLLCAMEEISWGQALVYYTTPFGLGKVNEQGELNIHNLPGVMELNTAFLLLFGVAGLVGIAFGRKPRLETIAVPTALGVTFGWLTLLGALAVLTDLFLIQFSFDLIIQVLTEAMEMLSALTCVVYVGLNGRMLRRIWASGRTATPG